MIGKVSNVKIVSSFKNKSKTYNSILSRKAHGFIYKLEGYTDYTLNGKTVRASAGDVAFLPKGSCYDYSSNNSTYASINFEADMEDAQFAIYSLRDFAGAHSMFEGFSEIWNFGNESDRYNCMSELYSLLSFISRIDSLGSEDKESSRILEPALNYLKENIFDTKLKVSTLHRLCGISDTYFRRLFTARFDMTPQKYITKERLSRARLIIESGDYENISSISETIGFIDPLYFSKAFKKQYGFPPSKLLEQF